jgi:hypothetical protein
MYATKCPLPLAKAGQLAACQYCQFAPNEKSGNETYRFFNPQGNDRCRSLKFLICAGQGEIFARYFNAHKTKNPDDIRDLIAELQGYGHANLQIAMQQLAAEGPTIDSAILRLDSNDEVRNIGTEIKANPVLKSIEVLAGIIKPGLNDWELTPASQTVKETGNQTRDALIALFHGNRESEIPSMDKPPANGSDD